jgi:aspartyl-tRNA(Asn)/glutamyl-tRNA(Gln) amidotransferase subunit C
MKITQEEVERTARLARLELSREEVQTMTAQLDTILSYVAKLDELDLSEVLPSTQSQEAYNAFREDQVRPSLPRDQALANGPLHDEAAFVVPKVIGA